MPQQARVRSTQNASTGDSSAGTEPSEASLTSSKRAEQGKEQATHRCPATTLEAAAPQVAQRRGVGTLLLRPRGMVAQRALALAVRLLGTVCRGQPGARFWSATSLYSSQGSKSCLLISLPASSRSCSSCRSSSSEPAAAQAPHATSAGPARCRLAEAVAAAGLVPQAH